MLKLLWLCTLNVCNALFSKGYSADHVLSHRMYSSSMSCMYTTYASDSVYICTMPPNVLVPHRAINTHISSIYFCCEFLMMVEQNLKRMIEKVYTKKSVDGPK